MKRRLVLWAFLLGLSPVPSRAFSVEEVCPVSSGLEASRGLMASRPLLGGWNTPPLTPVFGQAALSAALRLPSGHFALPPVPVQTAVAVFPAQAARAQGPAASPQAQLQGLAAALKRQPRSDAYGAQGVFSAHFDKNSSDSSGSAVDAVSELEPLQSAGYVVLDGEALFPSALEARLIPQLEALMHERNLNLSQYLDLYTGATRKWTNVLALQDILGEVQGSVDRLTASLKAALPGESFVLRDIAVRRVRGEVPQAAHPHVDGPGTYLVFTKTLGRGPSSILYLPRPHGGFDILQPPPGRLVGMTGVDREQAAGIEGTVHSAHPYRVEDRLLVIIRYQTSAPIRISDEVNARVRQRQEAVRLFLLGSGH